MLTEMMGGEADVRLLYEKLGQDAFFRVCGRVTEKKAIRGNL